MVLEYCGGGDLHKYYASDLFTRAEFARITNELLSGISYLHQRNVAHRDLKPANILLETSTLRVKIADFGLAKGTAQTATKGVGTPAYMPPELYEEVQSKEDTNLLALDVYALGIILWELWYQTAPFAGLPVARVVAHVMRGKRLPFAEVEGDEQIPELFRALIEECWAQEPSKRPPVANVARAIKKLFPAAAVKLARRRTTSNTNISNSSRDQISRDQVNQGHTKTVDNAAGSPAPLRRRTKNSTLGASKDSVAEGGLVELDAVAKGLQPAAPTLGNMSVPMFLAGCGLESHAGKFEEFGFSDVAMLGDRELLDDDTLLSVIGLTKAEVRVFRGRIATTGASPTLLRSRLSSKSGLGGKVSIVSCAALCVLPEA
jgi:serine/threonine protein kinase